MKPFRYRHATFFLLGGFIVAFLTFAGSVLSQTPIHSIATLPINLAATAQTTGTLPISRGGTGNTSGTFSLATQTTGVLSLTTQVSGTLPVANGGTGLAAPGASANVLTSNGSSWTSSPPRSAAPTRTHVLTAGQGDTSAYPCSSHTHNAPTAWSGSYTAAGGATRVEVSGTAYCATGTGIVTMNVKDGGSVVASVQSYAQSAGSHIRFPVIYYDTALSAGAHTLSATISDGTGGGTLCSTPCADEGDRLYMVVSEW